jgi:hypothetical protein
MVCAPAGVSASEQNKAIKATPCLKRFFMDTLTRELHRQG